MLRKVEGVSPGQLLAAIAFSEKVENLAAAVAMHFMYYYFAPPHQTLTKGRGGYSTTPAMAAGVTDRLWAVEDIVGLLEWAESPKHSNRPTTASLALMFCHALNHWRTERRIQCCCSGGPGQAPSWCTMASMRRGSS